MNSYRELSASLWCHNLQKSKKPADFDQAGFEQNPGFAEVLRGFTPDGEPVALEGIQHVRRDSGNALQIFPTLEGTVLKAMFHDLLGVISTDALNDGEFLFGCVVQIHIFRHDQISPFDCKHELYVSRKGNLLSTFA
jgi:hypothetical protein